MIRRFLLAVALTAAIGLAVAAWHPASAAQTWTLYVRRAQVSNVEQGGRVFAPIGDLLTAMGFTWKQEGTTLVLVPGKGGGPEIRSRMVSLAWDGRVATPQTLLVGGRVYVAVKPLAEAMGMTYLASAGIVQVSSARVSQTDLQRAVKIAASQPPPETRPTVTDATPSGKAGGKPTAEATPSKDGSKSGTEEDEIKAINEKRKDPLKVDPEPPQISNPAIPGSRTPAEVQGVATVKNVADLPVRNVTFTVTAADRSGQPLADMTSTISVAEIGPGETVSQPIHWWNYQNADIVPKVELKFDPLPEKHPAEKKDEGKSGSSDTKAGDKKAEKQK